MGWIDALKYGPIAIAALAAFWAAGMLNKELERKEKDLRPEARKSIREYMLFCMCLVVTAYGVTLLENWIRSPSSSAIAPPAPKQVTESSPPAIPVLPPPLGADWVHNSFVGADYKNIADWVNQECKPRDLSGIKGTVIVGEKVQTDVWCRKDESGVRWVNDERPPPSADWAKFVGRLMSSGDYAVIGFIRGSSANTLLMLRKR